MLDGYGSRKVVKPLAVLFSPLTSASTTLPGPVMISGDVSNIELIGQEHNQVVGKIAADGPPPWRQ